MDIETEVSVCDAERSHEDALYRDDPVPTKKLECKICVLKSLSQDAAKLLSGPADLDGRNFAHI